MFLNILCVYVEKPAPDWILVDNYGVWSSLLGYSKTYHFLNQHVALENYEAEFFETKNHKDGCIIGFVMHLHIS